MTRLGSAAIALVVVVAGAGIAGAQPDARSAVGPDGTRYAIDAEAVVATAPDGARAAWAVGCAGVALLLHDNRVWIACGRDGIAVVDLGASAAPRVTRHTTDGDAVGVFRLDDRVWVRIARTEARPVEGLPIAATTAAPLPTVATEGGQALPAPAPVPAPSPRSDATARSARFAGVVTGVVEGEAVVSVPEGHALRAGERLELYRSTENDVGDGRHEVREERLAVGEIVAIAPDRVRVALGLDERIERGARARLTRDEATRGRVAPPRLPGIWEVSSTVRGFLALEALGVGSVNEASVTRRMEAPWFARAALLPVSVGLADEGNVFTGTAVIGGGYDHRYFEIGLGIGVTQVEEQFCDYDEVTFEYSCTQGTTSLALPQTIRLGGVDGLHLAVDNAFALVEGKFHYAHTLATVQVPVFERSWLVARGGGGITGFGFGELAWRHLLRGNGDRGSLFIRASVGGAFIWEQDACGSDTCMQGYAGPMLGIGLEWRL